MSDHSDHIHEATAFAEKVRRELRAHPAEIVADLTDGLESDIAASLGDGAVLPSPASYANDLARGAGLEPLSNEEGSQQKLQQLMSLVDPVWSKVRDLTEGLAPAWWVFRAWIATQLLGAMINEVDSSYGIIGQWGEMPIGAAIVFVLFAVLSIRMGKSTSSKWKVATLVSHVVFIALSLMILSNETYPSFERYWQTHDGNPANFSNNTCVKTQVPDLTKVAAITAEAVLRDTTLNFVYIDQTTKVRVDRVSASTEILGQSIRMGTELCMGQELELFIDDSFTSAPGATSLVPEGQTDADGEMTTTTIPAKSSTTTVPKATTTTSP
jgi:hypothetical protein